MNPDETDQAAEPHAAAESRLSLEAPADEHSEDRLRRARRFVAMAGVLAGLAAFGVGEAVYELIPAAMGTINSMGNTVITVTTETMAVAEARNAALTFGVLGLCLGGGLGIAGGLARRSIAAVLVAGGLGAVLGLASSVGVSLALIPCIQGIQPSHLDYELLFSIVMHGSIWGLAGAAAGLAFAVGLGEPRMMNRAMAAGFVGALLGTIAFEAIGAAIFPLANTGNPISTTWPSRLTARLLVTLATAGSVALLLNTKRPNQSAGRRV